MAKINVTIDRSAIQSAISNQSNDMNSIKQEAGFLEKKQLLALQRMSDENNSRNYLTNSIFTITVMWMFFIILIVYAVGTKGLELSDTVLITLITTTTANVFGFMYIVARYLFKSKDSEDE